MKERGIIMSTPMVLATLDGRKFQTRRLVKLTEFGPSTTKGYDWAFRGRNSCWNDMRTADLLAKRCPHGVIGDRLYVKEAWETSSKKELSPTDAIGPVSKLNRARVVVYRAGGAVSHPDHPEWGKTRWKSSMFMPRWASRLVLEITEVRVQRLQSLDCVDIRHEGVRCPEHDGPGYFCCSECPSLRRAFAELWNAINGKRAPWESNPYVWAITFKRIEQKAKAA